MAKSTRANKVAVAFHIPADYSTEKALLELNPTIEDLFGADARRVKTTVSIVDEVMWAIDGPLLENHDTKEAFFKNLQRLLVRTAIYEPHFTQLPSFDESEL